MDDIGKVRPERVSPSPIQYNDLTQKPVENGAGTIALAIIAAAIIGVGGWIAYIEYSAYRAERDIKIELQAEQQRVNAARERQRLQQQRREEAARTRARQQQVTSQQNSAECQFWTLQHQNHATERTAAEVRKHCPLN